GEEGAVGVHRQEAAPLLEREAQGIARGEEARVREAGVDAAESLERRPRRAGDVALARHVAGDGQHLASDRLELGLRLAAARLVARPDRDARSGAREAARDPEADPAIAARHDGDAAPEVEELHA